jgi:hypothetical protein
MTAAEFNFTTASFLSKSGISRACFILNFNSYSFVFTYSSFTLSNLFGRFSDYNGNLCFELPSYCCLTWLILSCLRSSFSFSISASVFLNRFLGTGFALISFLIGSGYGITFGFGLVKLNGNYSVAFFFCGSSDSHDSLPVSPNLPSSAPILD